MSNDKKAIKEMRANDMTPAFPTHPGDVLKNEIEYRGISQRQLAEEMGIAYSALNEILNARRPVTEKTALLFEAALGVNAEPLLKMQMRYNLQSTKMILPLWPDWQKLEGWLQPCKKKACIFYSSPHISVDC